MAYILRYEGQVPFEQHIRQTKRWRWFIGAGILAAAVAIRYFWPEGAAYLQSIFIPGDDSVTVQAFQNLSHSLVQGNGFEACVTAFCREVIYGAG